MGKTPDIQLLFGVQGGGGVGGASGKLIKDQLAGIIANINKNPMGVKLKLDSTTEKSLTDAMSKALSNIEKKDLDVKVGKINADSAIAKFRKDLEAVVKSVSLQSGYSILLDKADVETIVAEYDEAASAAGKAANQAERMSQATNNAAKNTKKLSSEADTAIKTTNKTFNRATTAISKLGVSEEDVARAQALSQACVEVKKKIEQVREAGSSADDKLLAELEEARATLAKLTDETNEYIKTAHKAGKQGASSFSQVGAVTVSLATQFDSLRQKLGSFLSLHTLVTKLYSAAKNMVSVVTEIDTAMTELKKVTNETDAAYTQFLSNAAGRAKALGATISDTVNASADAARLGYDIDDASDLADAFLVYRNVGDGLNSIDDASASVISTMQAFGIAASDAMSIVDKFNNVGKKNCRAA